MDARADIIARLLDAEVVCFHARTPNSYELCQRAVRASMPLGVATNVSSTWPYPTYVARGEGAELVDVDGHRYVDFGAGYGTTVFGHAHPEIVRAVADQAARGTHFGAPAEVAVAWSEHLCDRFGLDWVRASASGTEATMDALRIARAHTGRFQAAKFDGAYHGSHPHALIAINQPLDGTEGPDDTPAARPADESLSPNILADVVVLPFNDIDACRTALAARELACVIVEPIMFNVGFIAPECDFLRQLRDACDDTGTLLIFDEVKTAGTIAWGGAEELYGVRPHLKTFGKVICGGLPGGAVGDTDGSTFSLIEDNRVMHVGTLSGNPLTAAAGHAALTRVLTPDVYPELAARMTRLCAGLDAVIDLYGLDAYTVSAGAKGCLVWAPLPHVHDFRDYARRFDADISNLLWLFAQNRGVWFAQGHDEQCTISVAHTDEHVQALIDVFAEFAQLLSDNDLVGR